MNKYVLFLLILIPIWFTACQYREASQGLNYEPPNLADLQKKTFESAWHLIESEYVYSSLPAIDLNEIHRRYEPSLSDKLDETEFHNVMKEMLAEFPGSTAVYLTRAERLQVAASVGSPISGIGSTLAFAAEPEPRLIILDVLTQSPAAQAGLHPHDAILAVDGQPVSVEEGTAVIQRIRGPAGSEVTLTIRSPGDAPREVTFNRDILTLNPNRLQTSMLNHTTVGYFRFPTDHYDGLLEDFLSAMTVNTVENNLSGLILDLRIAGPGDNWPLAAFLAVFTNGSIGEYFTIYDNEPLSVEAIPDFVNSQIMPLVILVGPNTQRSAESFAAALQGKERALIIGQPTLGNLEQMTSFILPDGSQLTLATRSFRTSNGQETGLNGITPDILILDDWDHVQENDDPVLDAALQQIVEKMN